MYSMFDDFSAQTSWQLAGILLLLLPVIGLAHLTRIKFRPGLRNLPGPLLASVSDLDRMWSCAEGSQMNYHIQLHEKYGPLVRVGPKHVSFSDARLIPQVYGITTKFYKVLQSLVYVAQTCS